MARHTVHMERGGPLPNQDVVAVIKSLMALTRPITTNAMLAAASGIHPNQIQRLLTETPPAKGSRKGRVAMKIDDLADIARAFADMQGSDLLRRAESLREEGAPVLALASVTAWTDESAGNVPDRESPSPTPMRAERRRRTKTRAELDKRLREGESLSQDAGTRTDRDGESGIK